MDRYDELFKLVDKHGQVIIDRIPTEEAKAIEQQAFAWIIKNHPHHKIDGKLVVEYTVKCYKTTAYMSKIVIAKGMHVSLGNEVVDEFLKGK